jgi:hypothetical protein
MREQKVMLDRDLAELYGKDKRLRTVDEKIKEIEVKLKLKN